MRIALVDLDMTGFPNLALMKLAAHHRLQGDTILPLNFIMGAERLYASGVFWGKRCEEKLTKLPPHTEVGGSAFDIHKWLPDDIEHLKPDYSLYNIDYSLGFTSRGCLRQCPWCIVPQKEGPIIHWSSIYEFWDHNHKDIVLLDNNLLAAPNWKEVLESIIFEGLAVDFNQGLDIRKVDEEKAHLLAKIRKRAPLRFSFDSMAVEKAFCQGIDYLEKVGIKRSSLLVYVLLGFESVEDDLARLRILSEMKIAVFPMNYQPPSPLYPSPLAITGTGRSNFYLGIKPFRGPRGPFRSAIRLIKARLGH